MVEADLLGRANLLDIRVKEISRLRDQVKGDVLSCDEKKRRPSSAVIVEVECLGGGGWSSWKLSPRAEVSW